MPAGALAHRTLRRDCVWKALLIATSRTSKPPARHRHSDVVELERILELRMKIAARSVNKWRCERICEHSS
jgi:hypothetical protein